MRVEEGLNDIRHFYITQSYSFSTQPLVCITDFGDRIEVSSGSDRYCKGDHC
jgi:hypothetical protein